MKLTVVLALLIGTLVLACSSAAPVPAEPTPNIDATVEAKLSQKLKKEKAHQLEPTDIPKDKPADTKTDISVPSFQEVSVESVGESLAFNVTLIEAYAGQKVAVVFENASANNQHNWVLVKGGVKDEVAVDGTTAGPSNNWVPDGDERVIANTELLNPGETSILEFTAPKAGVYQFVCTFPGHNFTMFGEFKVLDAPNEFVKVRPTATSTPKPLPTLTRTPIFVPTPRGVKKSTLIFGASGHDQVVDAQTIVAGYIVEHGYKFPINILEVSTSVGFSLIQQDSADIVLEIAPETQDNYNCCKPNFAELWTEAVEEAWIIDDDRGFDYKLGLNISMYEKAPDLIPFLQQWIWDDEMQSVFVKKFQEYANPYSDRLEDGEATAIWYLENNDDWRALLDNEVERAVDWALRKEPVYSPCRKARC